MPFHHFKAPLLGLFILGYSCLGLSQQSCIALLGLSFEDEAVLLLQNSQNERKGIEHSIHQSVGTLGTSLEGQLNQIFRLYNQQNRLTESQKTKILSAIEKDPIAHRLSSPSRAKLVRLVFRGYARPYMAFLIARYMDERENHLGLLTYDVMLRIERVVLRYTIEWTIRTLLRNRINDLNERERNEMLLALRNPSLHRDHRGINYYDAGYVVGYDSLFIGYLRERQAWIASSNLLNLSGSIFE